MIDLFIICAAGAAALGGAVFVVRYPIRTRGAWRHHPWGVHVMIFTVALMLLELQPVVYRLVGDWPFREEMLLVLMVALVGAHWHRVALNERDLQPAARRKETIVSDPIPSSTGRPRPVLWFAALLAAVNALAAAGDLSNVLPGRFVPWVLLASIVLTAAGAAVTQGAVTPLSDPRTRYGTPLVAASAMLPAVKAAARAGAHGGVAEAMASGPDGLEAVADAVREPVPRPAVDENWPGTVRP